MYVIENKQTFNFKNNYMESNRSNQSKLIKIFVNNFKIELEKSGVVEMPDEDRMEFWQPNFL